MKDSHRYSEFFKSGFRAMTARVSSSSACLASPNFFTIAPSTSRPIPRANVHRRARTMSMGGTPAIHFPIEESHHKRHSSFGLSSWFSDRAVSPNSSQSSSSSDSTQLSDTESPAWFTTDESFVLPMVSLDNDSVDSFFHVDLSTSSPEYRPYFIDLKESFHDLKELESSPKRESFLSLTSSSPDRSFLSLRSYRDRPTSIQTMPLPANSHRSSLQCRPPSQDGKWDRPWTAEEESLAEYVECDDPANIDWRQFHIELLSEDI